MITKPLPPSRSTQWVLLSLIISAFVCLAISSPAVLTYSILWIEKRIIVIALAVVCVLLGVWGLKKSKQNKPTLITRIICILGILLCIAIGYRVRNINKLPKVTGIISDIRSYEPDGYIYSLEVRPDEPAPDSLKGDFYLGDPVFGTDILYNTLVLKQTRGKLTRIVNRDQLKVNQHIEIEWNGQIYLTNPPLIDAIAIRILDR